MICCGRVRTHVTMKRTTVATKTEPGDPPPLRSTSSEESELVQTLSRSVDMHSVLSMAIKKIIDAIKILYLILP